MFATLRPPVLQPWIEMASSGYARWRWNGNAPWVVRSAIADGMERAAADVKAAMRRNLNVPYPPASRPGQFPRRRTGRLRKSIDYWLNKKTLEVWIGPSDAATYGLYLEFGTRRMKARPFMFRTLKQLMKRVQNGMNRAAAIAYKKYAGRKK